MIFLQTPQASIKPAKILDYLLKKEREVYNLRAIVRGKQAGLANEIIEELVVV